jgi:hypothetical protein
MAEFVQPFSQILIISIFLKSQISTSLSFHHGANAGMSVYLQVNIY